MAQTSFDCPKCVLTQVVDNQKQGRLFVTLLDPAQYFYIIVPSGETALLKNKVRLDVEEYDFSRRDPVDIYIFPSQNNGRIIFDDDAPITDVAVQDQHSPPLIAYFHQVQGNTTIVSQVALNDLTIEVASATGINIGSYLIIFNATVGRVSPMFVINVIGTTLYLDGPIDFAYPAGTFVEYAVVDMAVDGSTIPQVYGIRGLGTPAGISAVLDVTRIIIQGVTATGVKFGLFGDLPALEKGLLMRKRNAAVSNILNWKTNDDIANTTYDFEVYLATNPAQGVDGFSSRLTFAGQTKIGVALRVGLGDDIEFHIQDNLLDLTRLRIIAEGHIVD